MVIMERSSRGYVRRYVGVALWLLLSVAVPAQAYEAKIHQQLTFIAAKQFNQCAEEVGLMPLTPLQVRYVAKTSIRQVEGRWFRNWMRWNYYDRAGQSEKGMLWLVDTRFHAQFNDVVRTLESSHSLADRYSNLGRLATYLQDVTSPAHVVPVFYSRWWRLSMSDRFDLFPVDGENIERALSGDCRELLGHQAVAPGDLLHDAASATLRAVQRPIPGLPTSWQAFWRLSKDPGAFGEYGVAGNSFGRPAEFKCSGQNCVLLDNDPLYRTFAKARHVEAVRATLRVMAWSQAQDQVARHVSSR